MKSRIRPYQRRAFFTLTLLAAGILGAAVAPSLNAAQTAPTVPIPSATNILSRLRPSHPRLLATADDFAALKKRVASDPLLESWHSSIQSQAREILKAAPSRYEIPDGVRLLATSRRVMNRVYTLALLHRLDGDPQYAERAWQELAAAAEFVDWNPRHFLDTAEMTHAFAIAYDWLYDTWTPEQRSILHRAIVEKGLTPALKLYRSRSGWTRAHHNWNQVCNGGIGMGALALAEAEPALCGEVLHDAMESIQIAMVQFGPDGAWQEGPGYWNYATFYNVVFLAGLQSALGTEFGLSRIQGFSDTGLFPIYLTGPLGRTFNYADGGDHALSPAQMFWLAQEFKQPVCAWFERKAAGPSPLDVVWYGAEGVSPTAARLPLDKHFRGAEIAVLRSAWEDPRALFVGFKAGDNKANHSHLDVGSFVFDAAGVRWVSDLGADNYNLPGYFGNKRWTYYRLRAEGQNTLVLNPDGGPDQDPAASAEIIRFESSPSRSFAIADLSAAYRKHARKVLRGIALLDRNQLLVQDEISAAKPVDLWWFMHTPAAVMIESDGKTAHLRVASAELRVRILSPSEATFQLMEAVPLPASPQPDGQAKNDRIRKLAIHLPEVTESRLAVTLTPQVTEPAQVPKLPALAEW
jgi:hypothetical protein